MRAEEILHDDEPNKAWFDSAVAADPNSWVPGVEYGTATSTWPALQGLAPAATLWVWLAGATRRPEPLALFMLLLPKYAISCPVRPPRCFFANDLRHGETPDFPAIVRGWASAVMDEQRLRRGCRSLFFSCRGRERFCSCQNSLNIQKRLVKLNHASL